MNKMGKSRRKRKDKWGNRMALIGITFVVFSLAVIVTIKGAGLKEREREYELRLENLQAQVDKEEERSKKLEEYRVYVQTKQYIEEVAKQKLGLVNPDEILLKPSRRQ
ncbi:FtsB family cell division protein [Lacrimispora saccharolytica]|uniref:Septum formation initiator n=1 Tax=Lacrimispora saccharolytica (strain ATCC 35040 / DSM 2544 / NRCC 2533 / WM1) TaxID=610130 RepID=D9R2E9_LACSW|nr:septum formation initiator family protein [Lacrimispora saccharolytica]ADL06573.1 Septum formation initiator [[Clostridium] saccharolyticum WM1]QRV19351.1 septum formation initiator family protein [Lacrimispora saccharolytica]